jgi:hypothetical protein
MQEKNVPEKYRIDSLDLIRYTPPFKDEGGVECEAIGYRTSSNSEFSVAKDMMGVQICRRGHFFPKFVSFGSIEDAVDYLRKNTPAAIDFFDKVEQDKKGKERKRK